MKQTKIFMKSAGRRGYSPLARVMTLAVMLLAMAATAWAQQTYTVTFSANNNTKTVENVTLPHTFSASYNTANEEFDLILKELYGWSGNTNYLYPATAYDLEVSDGTKVVSTKPDSYTQCLTINNVFEGSVTVNGTYVVDGSEFEYTVAISISAPTKYTVTMAEGTGTGWTIEPAEATTTGVDKDTKITATYSGTRHVKSVTAVKKAAAPAAVDLDASNKAWADGSAFAVPAGGLTYSDAVTVSGNVTLTLTAGTTLTLNKGISLAEGATLTIDGTGTMVVNGTNESTASTVAGTGTLVLTSGTLTAKGGNGASTPGYSDNNTGADGGMAINGAVTVAGGALTATGGNGGNAGEYGDNNKGGAGAAAISGDVTMASGTIAATGGNGGNVGEYSDDCKGGAGGSAIAGNATLTGGTLTRTDGSNGSVGGYTYNCTAGAGGKAVAGTVTDNRN